MATPLNSLPFFLASSFLVSLLPLHSANQETRNSNSTCHNFSCGVVPTFKFSFSNITHPECGLFGIKCIKHVPRIKFEEGGREYIVKGISYEETTVVIQDYEVALHLLQSNFCSYLSNITTPVSPFVSFKISTPNYTFLRCNHSYKNPFQDYKKKVYNYTGCKDSVIHYRQGNLSVPAYHHPNCSSLFKYPLSDWLVNPYGSKVLETLLASGFALKWNGTQECSNCKCHENDGGLCSRNRTTGNFVCSNPRKQGSSSDFAGKQGSSRKKRIVIGATLAGVVLIAVFLFLLIGSRYWKFLIGSRYWWKKTGKASNAHNVEEFLENYGSLALRRYTYSDLKKITNSFKDKLGQGGYGGVFKGTLLDGRLVAVKVLNESKGNGEEFINEVGSIGRTYHVNVVALLGFCSEGSKRALIYEFMPNGSLEKFIYSEKPRQSQPLGWEKLCQIAIGIARGLEYLHRGCNTRILHFDIKPHNILLDEVFCPKISDFGLAKLCPMQNSTISMLGARGTVGYIAPEVYCRNIGGVSYKSDVYSYGMMVLEMVGGRKNIDAFVENTSEVYFPHWIYKRLTTYKSIDLQGYLGLHGIETGVEEGTARKMILVGLWCIQTNPLDRPSMSRVVEMLEGSVDGLQMPPQPFLSSSP